MGTPMIAAITLLLGKTAGSADSTFIDALREKGLVASALESSGGQTDNGILEDPPDPKV